MTEQPSGRYSERPAPANKAHLEGAERINDALAGTGGPNLGAARPDNESALPDKAAASTDEAQKRVWERLWEARISYHWDPLSQTVLDYIYGEIGAPAGLSVLEAGSGTGKISLRMAMDGAAVTLVDYAQGALDQSALAFRQKHCAASFVLADIRSMPLPAASFDLVWSAGVLEHFEFGEKVQILKEMARLSKPGGAVLVLVPYAGCLPYRLGKAYAEAAGTWMYGVEMPVESLSEEFAAAGLRLERETTVGFAQSLAFLDFIPGAQLLKQWAAEWHGSLDDEAKRQFPGYLLAAAGRAAAGS